MLHGTCVGMGLQQWPSRERSGIAMDAKCITVRLVVTPAAFGLRVRVGGDQIWRMAISHAAPGRCNRTPHALYVGDLLHGHAAGCSLAAGSARSKRGHSACGPVAAACSTRCCGLAQGLAQHGMTT